MFTGQNNFYNKGSFSHQSLETTKELADKNHDETETDVSINDLLKNYLIKEIIVSHIKLYTHQIINWRI